MVTKRNVMMEMLMIVLAAELSACGKRGDLTPPDGSRYPQQYPKQ